MPDIIEDIQTMAMPHFAVLVAVLVALDLYWFYLIWKKFHRARLVEDTPTARVRSAPQGYVELEGAGRSLPGKPVIAPLTGTACVWYRFQVDKEKHNSKSGSNWSEVESGRSEQPFLFFDDTGDCLVDPRGAEITPGEKKVWYGSSPRPGGAPKLGLFGELVGTRYRYTEERIDGDSLYLIGWFDTLRGGNTPVDTEVLELLRSWKRDQDSLVERFDRDGDGRVDGEEWEAAATQARQQVLVQRAARPPEPETSILRAGEDDRYPYLISARPQHELVVRYRRQSALALAASLACTGLLAWLLTVRF